MFNSRRTVTLPIFAILAAVCALSFHFARADELCEREALKSGGRAFLNLIRRGLSKGDLNVKDIEALLKGESPQSPVHGGRKITNHALKRGFARALAHLQPTEWPAIRLELKSILDSIAVEQKAARLAGMDSKNLFELKPVGYELDKDEELLNTFVSSTGDIYILTKLNEFSFLRELRSGSKVRIAGDSSYRISFHESPSLGVLVHYVDNSLRAKVLRASDLQKIFEQDLSSIETFKCLAKSKSWKMQTRSLLFESSGNPTLAVVKDYGLPSECKEFPPVHLFDLETKTEKSFRLPNVSPLLDLGPDGHLYAAGGGKDRISGKNIGFIKNLTLEKTLFYREYEPTSTIDFSRLIPQVYFDDSGSPRLYFFLPEDRRPRESHHLQLATELELKELTSYRGDNGGIRYAGLLMTARSYELKFGPLGRFATIHFPPNLHFPLGSLSIVNTQFGQMLAAWSYEDSVIREGFITDFTDAWIRFPISRDLDYRNASPPFYDRATKSTLIFMRDSNRYWKLNRIYGRFGDQE